MRLSSFALAGLTLCSLSVQFIAPAIAEQSAQSPSGSGGKHAYVLEGNASMDVDADAGNKELAVAWDNWRNRFVKAAWTKWGNLLDGGKLSLGLLKLDTVAGRRPHLFPNGSQATFTCVITKDRKIQGLRIVESSGDQNFDNMVLASVRALSGKSVLAFPKDSRREKVQQTAAFRIGGSGFHEHEFNDVERI